MKRLIVGVAFACCISEVAWAEDYEPIACSESKIRIADTDACRQKIHVSTGAHVTEYLYQDVTGKGGDGSSYYSELNAPRFAKGYISARTTADIQSEIVARVQRINGIDVVSDPVSHGPINYVAYTTKTSACFRYYNVGAAYNGGYAYRDSGYFCRARAKGEFTEGDVSAALATIRIDLR